MSEVELEFYYFKMHDYDNNNKLDGLEIVTAVTHYDDDGTCGRFFFVTFTLSCSERVFVPGNLVSTVCVLLPLLILSYVLQAMHCAVV